METLIPDLCRLPLLFAVVVGAEMLALVLVLGSGRPLNHFWQDLSLMSLFVQWIALVSVGVLCLTRRCLARLPLGGAAALAWAVPVLVGVVAGLLGAARVGVAVPPGQLALRSAGVAAVVGLFLIHYLHLHYRWRRQLMAEHRARMQALQSRIRPHFLFNSMNTIASLARRDPALAEEVTQDLADLFRVALSETGRPATLEQELELARHYLHIEGQRLGARLRVEWDLGDLPGEALLPPLVLQPLLENAVYHGIEPASAPGQILISGRYRRGRVNISIRNSLPETGGGRPGRSGNRMAMDNLRQRLQAMFDDAASLVEGVVDGDYQVRLVFPHPWRAA